jgi:NADH-quinone oxidoreductase subunit M
MFDLANLLPIAIAAPLAAAVVLALGGWLPDRLRHLVALAGFAMPAACAISIWINYPAPADGGFTLVSNYSTGLDALGISLRLGLNGVSMPLFVMAGIVGLAAGLYAMQSGAERLGLYLTLLLAMQGGLMGIFATTDVFFIYFFHELALIPTFIMVGIWGGRDRVYAAMKMTIYLTLGAMLSLVGLIAIYVKSGTDTFDLVVLRELLAVAPIRDTAQNYIFGFLMFGFGILVSLWPFHTWAPLGYGAAPSSAAMLHAGVLKKFGLYALIQVALPLVPHGAAHWAQWLAWLALGNVIIIGLVTLAQRDLKQMIGYSSVMHMGYCFLGIATLSAVGAGGVVVLMVAHGLSAALLFLLATCIHRRTGTLDMDEMGGLAKQAPVLAALFVAATFASIGLRASATSGANSSYSCPSGISPCG